MTTTRLPSLALLAALLGLSACTTGPQRVDSRQGVSDEEVQVSDRQAVQDPGPAAQQRFLVPLPRWESNSVVWDAGGQFRAFDNGFWRLDIPRVTNHRAWETPTQFDVSVSYFDQPGCPGTPVHTQVLLVGSVAAREQVNNLNAEGIDSVLQGLSSQLRCVRVRRHQLTGHAG